jgi:hypothetical protein
MPPTARTATRLPLVSLTTLGISLGAVLTTACGGPAQTIGIGQSIHHDDFEYSVRSVETRDRIGALGPAGVFHVVTFQVENRARRVGHDWDNTIAYLLDEQGREYENIAGAQRQLNDLQPFGYQNRYHTNAGDTETTKFVFDLPRAEAHPVLRVRGETLMGDVFDRSQFRRISVKLY